MRQALLDLIKITQKIANNPRRSEETHKLARDARNSVMEILRLYNNPQTKERAEATLDTLVERKDTDARSIV